MLSKLRSLLRNGLRRAACARSAGRLETSTGEVLGNPISAPSTAGAYKGAASPFFETWSAIKYRPYFMSP